jgi:hypothetical protein
MQRWPAQECRSGDRSASVEGAPDVLRLYHMVPATNLGVAANEHHGERVRTQIREFAKRARLRLPSDLEVADVSQTRGGGRIAEPLQLLVDARFVAWPVDRYEVRHVLMFAAWLLARPLAAPRPSGRWRRLAPARCPASVSVACRQRGSRLGRIGPVPRKRGMLRGRAFRVSEQLCDDVVRGLPARRRDAL